VRVALLIGVALVFACGGAQPTGRERVEHAENKGLEAERAIDQAEAALDGFEPDRAESLLEDAADALRDPNIAAYPEHQLLKERVRSAESRVISVRAEIARRDLEARVNERRKKIEEALAALTKSMEAVKKPFVSKKEVETAWEAAEEVREEIEEGEELTSKDPAYAAWVREVLANLAKPRSEMDSAKKLVAFKEGSLEKRRAAAEALDRAKAEKDPADQRELYGEALAGFRACEGEAKKLSSSDPDLAKRPIALAAEEKPTSAKALKKICAQEAKSIDKTLAKLLAKQKAEEAKAKRAAEALARAEAKKQKQQQKKKKK
jgi:hypothetical protein